MRSRLRRCHHPDSGGQLEKTCSDTSHPIEYAYNGLGQRTDMYTHQEGTAWTASAWPDPEPTGDHTAWTLDAGTGLVKEKTYADGKNTTYTYTADGRLLTRI